MTKLIPKAKIGWEVVGKTNIRGWDKMTQQQKDQWKKQYDYDWKNQDQIYNNNIQNQINEFTPSIVNPIKDESEIPNFYINRQVNYSDDDIQKMIEEINALNDYSKKGQANNYSINNLATQAVLNNNNLTPQEQQEVRRKMANKTFDLETQQAILEGRYKPEIKRNTVTKTVKSTRMVPGKSQNELASEILSNTKAGQEARKSYNDFVSNIEKERNMTNAERTAQKNNSVNQYAQAVYDNAIKKGIISEDDDIDFNDLKNLAQYIDKDLTDKYKGTADYNNFYNEVNKQNTTDLENKTSEYLLSALTGPVGLATQFISEFLPEPDEQSIVPTISSILSRNPIGTVKYLLRRGKPKQPKGQFWTKPTSEPVNSYTSEPKSADITPQQKMLENVRIDTSGLKQSQIKTYNFGQHSRPASWNKVTHKYMADSGKLNTFELNKAIKEGAYKLSNPEDYFIKAGLENKGYTQAFYHPQKNMFLYFLKGGLFPKSKYLKLLNTY